MRRRERRGCWLGWEQSKCSRREDGRQSRGIWWDNFGELILGLARREEIELWRYLREERWK
jgi:hypothetical protein